MIKDHPSRQDKPELTLRAANRMDAPALAAMARALAEEEGRVGQADATAIETVLADGRAAFLIAEAEGGACGMLMHYPGYDLESASYGAHLADLYVMPALRRRGIASQLVARLARDVLNGGGAWLSLTVLAENRAAQSFYASLGLSEVNARFMAIGPKGLRLVNLRLAA